MPLAYRSETPTANGQRSKRVFQWRRWESNPGPRPPRGSVYERSRASESRLPLANPAGLEEASPLRCHSAGEDGRWSQSPFLMPAIRPTGRGRADSSLA